MRYLRLYLHFLRFSFSRAMEFRLDFTFRIVMDTLWYAVNWSFFWLLFRHTTLLGGWSYDQTIIFLAGVFVADAIQMTVLSNNMWWLPIHINKGDLDYTLVRPASSLFFLSLREFAANSFINLLMAVGIFIWAIARYPLPLGAGAVTLYVAMLLVGVFLNYSLQMLSIIPAFWLHTAGGLRDIFWTLDQFAQRPHGLYKGWIRRILVSILPFAIIISFPAQALFTGATWQILAHLIGVTAAAFLVMLWTWQRGLRAYSSASS